MHPALRIQEIVLNIADQCVDKPDLYALARTCRAFKEPALDTLWEVLYSLAPVVRCLPEVYHAHLDHYVRWFCACLLHLVSQRIFSSYCPPVGVRVRCYSFRRPLAPEEWDILHSYTRRIRSLIFIGHSIRGVGPESLRSLSRSPTGQPAFPNLRFLGLDYTGIEEQKALFCLPLPSLISVNLSLMNPRFFDESIKSLAENAPNLKKFIIPFTSGDIDMSNIDFRFICQWKNLQAVVGSTIFLDLDTLMPLSRTCMVTELDFSVSDALATTPPATHLYFPNLLRLTLNCQSLAAAWRLLSHTLLPVIKKVVVIFYHCPSKLEISLLATTPATSFLGHTIQDLTLVQHDDMTNVADDSEAVLGFEHLQPCTAFSNLCFVTFNMKCKVNLVDHELLALASAWPRLEKIGINGSWGWRMQGGITPNGLLQLLQKCPLLHGFELALNLQEYTDIPPSPASLGLTTPRLMLLNVIDSAIEPKSVPAVAALFSGIVAVDPRVHMIAWDTESLARGTHPALADRYYDRWMEVIALVKRIKFNQGLWSDLF